jgi:formylglycine-generating enzyme required for sulfatase activity
MSSSFRFLLSSALLSSALLSSALLSPALLSSACTSFAFKPSSKGTAPNDLQDRALMVAIEGGTFQMGFKNGEPDEFPPHKVALSPYLLDKLEVTVGDYDRCVDARVCKPVEPLGTPVVTPLHPAIGVTWFEAKRYCEWVGKRLPTEAEWEYAARRPHFALYPWGGPSDGLKANARGTKDGFEFTAPVGSLPAGATAAGIMDLAGNVSEWTADWYDATWYQKSTERNPTGPEAATGERVIRGGSWSDPDYVLRSTTRLGLDPNVSNSAVGFRCASTP